MDPSRLGELEELFELVMERAVEHRAAAIDELCDDQELREALALLVESADDASGYFEGLGERIAEGMPSELARHEAGKQASAQIGQGSLIGEYRVEREIGSGGMGRVYLASKPDDDTPVAIKVLRNEVLEPEVVARFSVERSFLAGINHSNIARLIDAGTLPAPRPDGAERPYFVMEFVEGLTFDRYCAARRLGLRDRLLLFCRLCDAVHFLHQNLVVHRDIKPGNVLVNTEGEPKLLDFGIAKFLDPSGLRWKGDDTRAELRLFTPDYASPEQVLGEAITTATDVFSLGALLYQLLTGQKIRQLESSSYPDLIRSVETEPTRPSTATAGRAGASEKDQAAAESFESHWQHRLAGDLDAILLKALRREPEQRYLSAADLAEDLRRYLDGEPVEARRGGLRYRAGKFVRRHRLALAVAGLFLLALVAFTAVTFRAQQRAELEARRAEAINSFLTEDLLEGADPRRQLGRDVTMKQVLDAADVRIDERFEDDPLVEADIRRSLGRTYHLLGDYDSAVPQLRRSVELREEALGEFDPDTIAALSSLANLISDKAEYEEALPLQEDTARRARTGLDADDPKRLSILNNLASLYSELNRRDDAEPLYVEVLEAQRRVLGEDHESALVTASNLARLWERQGRIEEAEELHVDTLERSRRALGEDHPYSYRIGTYLASLYTRSNRYQEAESLHQRNFDGQSRTLGVDHPDTLMSRNNLAVALFRQQRFEEAKTHFQQVVKIRRDKLGVEHPSTLIAIHNLAGAHLKLGDFDPAVELSSETVAVAKAAYPEGHPNHAMFSARLALGLLGQGQGDRARPLLQAAQPVLLERFGAEHPAVVEVDEALASLSD